MRTRSVFLILLLASPAFAGDWSAQFSTPDATNRASSAGDIRNEPGATPGFVRTVSRQERVLPAVHLRDLDGDDVPEVVFLEQGALSALDPTTGALRWRSIPVGADGFLGEVDVTGQGSEFLITAGGLGGGAYLVEPLGGGLTPLLTVLPGRSGVTAAEVTSYDLDGDGVLEMVVPAGAFALDTVWTVDMQGSPAAPALAATTLSGYSNLTPARAGRLLDPAGTAVVINQGAQYQLYDVCAAGDASAVCDAGEGTLCLCDQGIFYGVHNTFSFGPGFVVDSDGDGIDEVVEVASNPRYTNAVYSLDFAAGIASGGPVTNDLRRWYRGYPAGNGISAARLITPDHGPVDLDGDGDLELVVSFVDNTTNDVDGSGNPIDDGIDNAGGVSFAVFDLATGEVLASGLDAFAYGATDTDGDGTPELITSPTVAWNFSAGLSGHVLDCAAAPCTLTEQWTDTTFSLVRDRTSLANLGTPPATLPVTDLDGDGDLELIGYQNAGTSLVAGEHDGSGAFAAVATAALGADDELVATDPEGSVALLRNTSDIFLVGADFRQVGLRMKIPVQGWETMLAGSLVAGEPGSLVYENFAHLPGRSTPAPLVLSDPAMLVDLDGDGASEVVGFANPPDSGGDYFVVGVQSWDPAAGAFSADWTLQSDDPSLDLPGFVVTSRINWHHADFNGDSVDDIVFAATAPPDYRQIVLDGATGAVLHVFEPGSRPSSVGPILIDDRVDSTGAPNPDGTLDILVHGSSYLEWVTPGSVVPVATSTTGYFHSVSANGDLDGDGLLDNVVMPSSVTSRIEALTDLGSPTRLWANEPVGLLPTITQLTALADIDAAAGLDVLFVTGDAELIAYSGADGSVIAGFPVYVAAGVVYDAANAPSNPAVPSALIAMDVDGDGYEEAVVGSSDGRIYAVNLGGDDTGPDLAWTLQVGAGVGALAAAQMDDEPGDELLVSTLDGRVQVVGPVGVCLEIEYPAEGECVHVGEFVVRGRSCDVATIAVFGAGAPGSEDLDASSDDWTGSVTIDGEGNHTVSALGYDADGRFIVLDLVEVVVDAECEGERPEPEGDDDDSAPVDDDDSAPMDDDDAVGDDDDSAAEGDTDCSDCGDGCAVGGVGETAAGMLLLPLLLAGRRRR